MWVVAPARSFQRLAGCGAGAGDGVFFPPFSRAWCARPRARARASACGCAGGCHCRPLARRPSRAVALSPRLPATPYSLGRHGFVWLLCAHSRHCLYRNEWTRFDLLIRLIDDKSHIRPQLAFGHLPCTLLYIYIYIYIWQRYSTS